MSTRHIDPSQYELVLDRPSRYESDAGLPEWGAPAHRVSAYVLGAQAGTSTIGALVRNGFVVDPRRSSNWRPSARR